MIKQELLGLSINKSPEAILKQMIWIFRSRLSKKQPILEESTDQLTPQQEQLKPLFNKLSPSLDQFSLAYIQKRYRTQTTPKPFNKMKR